MSATTERKRRSPRTERVSVFCTPGESVALKVKAAEAGKPINQFVLDTLGVSEIDTTGGETTQALHDRAAAGDRDAMDTLDAAA